MADVLAHPFRLAGTAIAVVDDATDDGVAQEIAVLVSTRAGERPLVPDYGLGSAEFDGIDVTQVNAGLAAYGPPGVTVTDLEVAWTGPAEQAVTLTFDS